MGAGGRSAAGGSNEAVVHNSSIGSVVCRARGVACKAPDEPSKCPEQLLLARPVVLDFAVVLLVRLATLAGMSFAPRLTSIGCWLDPRGPGSVENPCSICSYVFCVTQLLFSVVASSKLSPMRGARQSHEGGATSASEMTWRNLPEGDVSM